MKEPGAPIPETGHEHHIRGGDMAGTTPWLPSARPDEDWQPAWEASPPEDEEDSNEVINFDRHGLPRARRR